MKFYYELVIGFLTGAAWALVVILSSKLFLMYLHSGIHYALLAGLIGLIIGLFLVVIVEVFSIQVERLSETKKQTKLLEDILRKIATKDD